MEAKKMCGVQLQKKEGGENGYVPSANFKMGGDGLHKMATMHLGSEGINLAIYGTAMKEIPPYLTSELGQKPEYKSLLPLVKNMMKGDLFGNPVEGNLLKLTDIFYQQIKNSSYLGEIKKQVQMKQDILESNNADGKWDELTFEQHVDAECYLLARIKAFVMSNLDEASIKEKISDSLFKEFDRMLNDTFGVMNLMIVEIMRAHLEPEKKVQEKQPPELSLESLQMATGYATSYAIQNREDRMKEAKAYGYESLAIASEELAERSYRIYSMAFSEAKELKVSKNSFLAVRVPREGKARVSEDKEKRRSLYASDLSAMISKKGEETLDQPKEEKKREKNASDPIKEQKKLKNAVGKDEFGYT